MHTYLGPSSGPFAFLPDVRKITEDHKGQRWATVSIIWGNWELIVSRRL